MGSFFENIIDEGFRFLDELIRKIFYELTYVDSSLIKEEAHYVEKMAEFGWTYCYTIRANFNQVNVETLEEIDCYFYNEFTKDGYDEIIEIYVDAIKIYPQIHNELLEAVACYENKEYRGCAMIITSLIEKLFILSQKQAFDSQNVKTGLGATNRIYKMFDDHLTRLGEDFYLTIISMQKFLNIFFEKTNNFQDDKKIINRNMLMHGMWTNDVTRIDCMKLFLALYNQISVTQVFFH